ncbi:hypothetical protein BDY19DRAFT_927237 [Irpex rosettiformis]|uniref:Uncharacterized protein n=1 Tax=Irpex rosettiformis TaxID=378272 RepID=A0ACB8UCA6_9APHY|nr:hypothetical protein BDY19DRAFT_927237 [Irpex rosettiformis]
MSSWSGSGYPPPRGRSRSRSPYRPGYGPQRGGEAAYYPPDSYRGDWDPYERDRAWQNYERDRATYDFGRRGRSRSPPVGDDTGRKRRRSASPYDRERYDPRPRYEDYDVHARGYGHTSPHRSQYPPPPSNRRAPQDPHTFDYPASLKQYAEWFRYFYPQQAQEEDSADKTAELEAGDGSKPRNGIRARWEKYKKDFAAQQLQRMFEHHRKSPWFAEKYDPSPEFVQLRARVRKEGWKGHLSAFLAEIETGTYDPDLNESEPAPSSPSVKQESSTNGDATHANGTNAVGVAVEESKQAITTDDAMQFNVEPDDEGGDQDAARGETNGSGRQNSDSKRPADRGEEISIPPEGNQVMIRTIPPDIGRIKLEEACTKIPGFIYLALGDPLQKRNYYRAGWIKFKDDADMSTVMTQLTDKKIEGFKLHVAHIMKPFTSRIRYAPEVASKPDRVANDLANAKVLAAKLEDEAAKLRQLRIETQSNGASGLEQTDSHMSDANEDNEESEPKERGSDAIERRVDKIIADLRDQGLIDLSDEKAVEEKRTVISLDLYLAYLRAAFNTCYYCAVITDHVEELQRKCVKHVRKPLSKALLQEIKAAEAQRATQDVKKEDESDKEKEKDVSSKEKTENRDWKRNDERWLEWLDSKIALLLDRDGVDPREYSGKSYDEELSKACESYIKQEDEGKFRCKTCQKLFKATSFVEKHIANKHPDLVKHLEDIPYFNNFILDPHHIQPFNHAPQPTGGAGQAPPPQAYGLQAPAYPPADYGRSGPYHGGYPGYPPPYPNSGYWGEQYAFPAMPPGFPPPRREEGVVRRLSDRISGFAPGYEQSSEVLAAPASAGLPAKPPAAVDPGAGGRRGVRSGSISGALPPPPPDAKEDPRAAAGKKVSYHDMDLVAEGDVELMY